ncbi:MAG: PAS domain S-box protein [Bacteroidota bacterium]
MRTLTHVLYLFCFLFIPNGIKAQPFISKPNSDLVLELKWFHQFQFAGYYAADINGFYEQEGLNITIREGRLESDQVQNVLDGTADFAIYDSGLLVDYANGKDVVVLDAIFQYSPYVIAARADRNFVQLADFANAKIMVGDIVGKSELLAVFGQEGIDTDSMEFVLYNKEEFFSDSTIDAIHGYVTADLQELMVRGMELDIYYPWRYGVDFYGDLLFTRSSLLASSPIVVKRFEEASRKGWEYAREHEEEIIDYILSLPGVTERGITRELLRLEAQKTWEYSIPDKIPLGFMSEDRWTRIGAYYVASGLIDEAPVLDDFLAKPGQSLLERLKAVLKYIITAILASIGAFLLWIYALKSEVRKRTKLWVEEYRRRQRVEFKHKELINNIEDVVFEMDKRGVFTYLSPRTKAITGFDPEECIGVLGVPFTNPGDRRALHRRYIRRMSTGIDDRRSFRFVKKSGQQGWLVSTTQLKEHNGELRVTGTFRDITKEIEVREALKLSEERYENVVQNITECVFCMDTRARFTFVSTYITDLIDELPESLAGMSFDYIVLDEDKPNVQKALGELTKEEVVRFNFRLQNKDGLMKWIEANCKMVINPEGQQEIQGTLKDISDKHYIITALKRSEERFKRITERSPVGIVMILNNEYIYANTRYAEIFETSVDRHLNQPVDLDRIHPGDRKMMEENMRRLVSGEKKESVNLYRAYTYNDRPIFLEYYTTTIQTKIDTIIFSTAIDITERENAKRALEQSVSEKNVLLSEIHHRVKNNMAVISGLMELQRFSAKDENTRMLLQDAQLRIKTIASIHEQLYNNESFTDIPFRDYLYQLLEGIQNTMFIPGLDVVIHKDITDCPLNINQAIPLALFINEVITNSFKHAFSGREKGNITVSFRELDDRTIHVSITDDGIGLLPKYRESKSLGMVLIKTLSQQLGGTLTIGDGKDGTGCAIELSFNAKEETGSASGIKA